MSQQVNLFNPVFMSQKKYFSAVAMVQGLVLVMLGSALFYGYALYRVKTLAEQFDEVSKRYVAGQEQLSRYTAEFSPQESRKALEKELKQTEARLSTQERLIETLKSGAIGNVTGYSEYMRAFASQSVNGLWLTSFDIIGDATQMRITGRVLSPELLPAYMLRLNREPVMRGKPFASLHMVRGSSDGRYVDFTLMSDEAVQAEEKTGKE